MKAILNFGFPDLTGGLNYVVINIRGIEIGKSLGWMNVRQRYFYLTTTLMFNSIHGRALNYMVNDVVMNCDEHQMNTKSISSDSMLEVTR